MWCNTMLYDGEGVHCTRLLPQLIIIMTGCAINYGPYYMLIELVPYGVSWGTFREGINISQQDHTEQQDPVSESLTALTYIFQLARKRHAWHGMQMAFNWVTDLEECLCEPSRPWRHDDSVRETGWANWGRWGENVHWYMSYLGFYQSIWTHFFPRVFLFSGTLSGTSCGGVFMIWLQGLVQA